MTEMTPETLRELPGDWFQETGYIAPNKVIAALYEASSAWEADQMIANGAARMAIELECAEARIEALEKALDICWGQNHIGPRLSADEMIAALAHAAIKTAEEA